MDYGLLGGLGEGLRAGIESYRTERDYAQKKRDKSEEDEVKKRLARAQEVDSAAKIADITGGVPKGLFSEDIDHVFNPESQGQSSGLIGQPQQPSGLVSQEKGAITGSEGYLTKPIDSQFMPKHVREGIKEATQLSAQNYGKGVTYKYDPDSRTVRQFSAPMSEEHTQDVEGKRLGNEEKKKSLGTIKPEQAKAATYGKRMIQSEEIFKKLEDSGYSRASAKEGFNSMLPALAQSSNLREQDQAERNFVNAVLRNESGSAINANEFASAEKQYFPRPGDSPEVLANKAANRQLAINGMKLDAGDQAWNNLSIPKAIVKKSKKTGGGLIQSAVADGTPKSGEVHDGYRFKGGDPGVQSNWEKVN